MKSVQRDTPGSTLLCHLALWFGLAFATPLFIAAHNQEDLAVGLGTLAAGVAGLAIVLTLTSLGLARLGGARVQWWVNRALLSLAIVAALQGNFVHDLFEYGAFNGAPMVLRALGWPFWLEWLAWLTAPVAIFVLLSRVGRMPSWLPALPLVSFTILLLPALMGSMSHGGREDAAVDPDVYGFSTRLNVIHLLADGFQGDVVREALEQHPDLAEKFRGFTLFTDHLGLYQGTAPALYTLLTGSPYDLGEGFSNRGLQLSLEARAYHRELAEHGFRLDFVPISSVVCPPEAASCLPRPFSDMKARGLERNPHEDVRYSLRLIFDLSLFRLSPMYLKEKIYDNGNWLLADTTADGSSPWPDPVIREWTENFHLLGEQPVYKWHHFIGTHIPAKWNSQCQIQRDLPHERSHYVDQAYCVLSGIAGLLERLDEAGVYDQTAMVISGDHGHNIRPDDLVEPRLNYRLLPGMMGSARPALLVKRLDDRNPLVFSQAPTALVDIAPTVLELAGIDDSRPSVFDIDENAQRIRHFTPYSINDLWRTESVPYSVYEVRQPANEGENWRVVDIRAFRDPPRAFDPVNYRNASGFMIGAILDPAKPDDHAAWVKGRQLAFLVDVPSPGEGQSLDITLHLPEGIEEQGFTLSINGEDAVESPRMAPVKGFWQDVSVPLDPGLLQPGRNFISLLFDHTYDSATDPDWHAAALIRTIRISDSVH